VGWATLTAKGIDAIGEKECRAKTGITPMKPGSVLSGFMLMLLFSERARRTVQGLVMLRRAHEHVLVMAALEGARDVRSAYYDGYVDALEILSARALLVARAL
jgi:hypothetical protein